MLERVLSRESLLDMAIEVCAGDGWGTGGRFMDDVGLVKKGILSPFAFAAGSACALMRIGWMYFRAAPRI